jgi:tRNA(adenine34) deaminase
MSDAFMSSDVPLRSISNLMSNMSDFEYMRLAIEQAYSGKATPGGGEVGAVLVKDGQVAVQGFNEAGLRHDPTAHAEMVVIRRLCADLKSEKLEGYTLYCTLQPCGMCTMACLWAGISRIVFGAGRNDVHAVYFESRHNDTVDFIKDAFRNDLQIDGEILAGECAKLYAKPDDPVSLGGDPAHEPTKPPH